MAAPIIIPGDAIIQGTLSVGVGVNLPTGSVTNEEIAASAGIEASKLQTHFRFKDELFAAATTVAAVSKYVFTAHAAGSLLGVEAVITGAIATGADRIVSIDLKKSTAGGAFASVLSGVFGFTNSSTLLVPVSGTIVTPNYIAGDTFEIVVTVAGSASAQATGLGITIATAENYV